MVLVLPNQRNQRRSSNDWDEPRRLPSLSLRDHGRVPCAIMGQREIPLLLYRDTIRLFFVTTQQQFWRAYLDDVGLSKWPGHSNDNICRQPTAGSSLLQSNSSQPRFWNIWDASRKSILPALVCIGMKYLITMKYVFLVQMEKLLEAGIPDCIWTSITTSGTQAAIPYLFKVRFHSGGMGRLLVSIPAAPSSRHVWDWTTKTWALPSTIRADMKALVTAEASRRNAYPFNYSLSLLPLRRTGAGRDTRRCGAAPDHGPERLDMARHQRRAGGDGLDRSGRCFGLLWLTAHSGFKSLSSSFIVH